MKRLKEHCIYKFLEFNQISKTQQYSKIKREKEAKETLYFKYCIFQFEKYKDNSTMRKEEKSNISFSNF